MNVEKGLVVFWETQQYFCFHPVSHMTILLKHFKTYN